MKPLDIFLFIIGIFMIVFGLLLLIGSGINFNDPESTNTPVTWAMMALFFGVLPTTAGLWLCVTRVKKGSKDKQEEIERTILTLAKDNGGLLSATDIALKTTYSSDEAGKFLEEMHSKSLIEMEVTEKGSIVYRFPGMFSSQDKQSYRGYSDDSG